MLAEEGLRDMQAFAALTPSTETNILACLAAKRMGVRKTIAMVENMDYVSLAEKLDIGTVINKKTIAASHIYQMMLDTQMWPNSQPMKAVWSPRSPCATCAFHVASHWADWCGMVWDARYTETLRYSRATAWWSSV